jgi:hypothetical protein
MLVATGGVAGRRSDVGEGPDPGRGAPGAGPSPGKSPLTGGLDRTLAQRTVQLQPKDGPHLAEMTASAKADAFTRLLDKVDQEVAAGGYSFDRTAVKRWDEVNDAWAALEAKTRTAMKPPIQRSSAASCSASPSAATSR